MDDGMIDENRVRNHGILEVEDVSVLPSRERSRRNVVQTHKPITPS